MRTNDVDTTPWIVYNLVDRNVTYFLGGVFCVKIGVLKEIKENEYRVSAVPATVQEITRHGHTVYVEAGAGVGSGFSDAEYEAAGAIIADTDTVWREVRHLL